MRRARLGLGERDQVGERTHRQAVVDHQHIGLGADEADRIEIVHRIESDLGVEADIGGEDGVVAEKERIAVRRRMRDQLAGDIAAGTRTVIDDDRLSEQAGELIGDDARQDVARAAGRKADDDGDRPVGYRPRRPGPPGSQQQQQTRKRRAESVRIRLLPVLWRT